MPQEIDIGDNNPSISQPQRIKGEIVSKSQSNLGGGLLENFTPALCPDVAKSRPANP